MKIFTRKWLKAASIRAIKTMAQTAVGILGAATALNDINWGLIGSASILAGLGSLLTSLAGLPELNEGDEDD